MQYSCIGEHLTHSFSKEILAALAEYLYERNEIPAGALDAFMTQRDFQAVTIPYKQGGALSGCNTDFAGMFQLIRRAGIVPRGKKVLILGTGSTSDTAMAVARYMGAASAYKVSRTGKTGALTYDSVKKEHLDSQILINTTPCGMFSCQSGMAIDPGLFPGLSGVVDAVYNPLRTEFVLKARRMGIPSAGGLYMLVAREVLASQVFLGRQYPADTTEQVYRRIREKKENIVLTGMPGSGKTMAGKLLAQKLGRPYVDTDGLIEEKTGRTPGEIILSQGEAAFRKVEAAVIREVSSQNGAVIATGGGSVLLPENVDALRMNGRIFFLDRPVEQLVPTPDRPLSATREAIMERHNERYSTYVSTADVVIASDSTPEAAVLLVERSFIHEDSGD